MKQLLAILTLSIALIACSEAQDSSTQVASKSSGQCDALLQKSIKTSLENTSKVKGLWENKEQDNCYVTFMFGDKHYKAELDLADLGTANDEKKVGVISMTQFEITKKTISFYQDKEMILNVGDEAIYYSKRDQQELAARLGSNAISLSVYDNWEAAVYDKAATISIAKDILKTLAK